MARQVGHLMDTFPTLDPLLGLGTLKTLGAFSARENSRISEYPYSYLRS